MKTAIDSIVLEATFAAVSSPGVRARLGRSAAWAGRNGVPTTVDSGHDRVDDGRGPVGGDHGGGGEHQQAAQAVRGDHHELAGVPVGERREQRRRDGCGEHAHEQDDPDRGRASLRVGVDRECDQVRPVADHRADPGELESSHVRVAEHGRERGRRLADALAQPHRVCKQHHIRGKISRMPSV